MTKRFQSSVIPQRQSVASDAQKFPHRNIQENHAGFRQIIQIIKSPIDLDPTAEFMEISGERVCDSLRSTARNWPANGVSREAKDQRKCRRDRRLQRKK